MKAGVWTLFGFLTILGVRSAGAQMAIGDAKDNSAVVVQQGGGTAHINFGDSSAKAGYLWQISNSALRYGVEFGAKAGNGYAALLKGSDVSPTATASVWVGYQPRQFRTVEEALKGKSGPIRAWWTTLKLGYVRSENVLVDESKPLAEQVTKKKLGSPDVAAYANALTRGNILWCLGGGLKRTSNYDDLKKVDLIDTTVLAAQGGETRTVENRTSGRTGNYAEFTQLYAAVDVLWVPDVIQDRVGFDFFWRGADNRGNGSQSEPGVTLCVLQKGAPTKIVAGLTAQRDASTRDLKIGLTLGHSF